MAAQSSPPTPPSSSWGRSSGGHLRDRYAAAPDPYRLLSHTFTLRELRLVHEAVAGHQLQRDTFRRAMAEGLEPTGRLSSGPRGRAAELFHHR